MVAPNGHVRSLATLLELSGAPANDPQGCSGLLPGIEVPYCFLQDVSEPRVAIARITDLLKQAPGRKMEIGTLQGLVPPKHWRSVDQLRKCEGFERKTYTPKGSKNGSGGEFLKLRNFQPHSSWRQGLVSVNRSSAAALCRLSSAAAALLWPQHTSNNRHYLAVSICAVLVHNWSARQQEERYALPAVAWLELKQLQPLLRKQCKADQRLSQILSGARNVEKLQSQMASLLGAEEFGPWLTVEERQDSVFVMYAVSAAVQLLCRSLCAIINLPEGWTASGSAMHAPSDGFFLPDFMGDDVLSCAKETAGPYQLGSEDRGTAAVQAGQQKGVELGARMTSQHGSGSSQLQGGGCGAAAQLPAADCSAPGGYFEQLLGASPLDSSPAPFMSSLFSSTSMLAAAAPSMPAAHAFRSTAQPVGMQLPQLALFPAGDGYDPVTGSPPLSAAQFSAAPSPLAAAGSPATMSLFAVGSPGGLSCPAEIQACWHSKKPKPHPSNLSRCTAAVQQRADEMPAGVVGEGLMSKDSESIPIITGFSPRVQGEEAHGGQACDRPEDDAPPSPATMSLLSSTPWSHTPVLELGGKQLPCKPGDRALRPLQQQLPLRALEDAAEPCLARPSPTWGSAGVNSLSQKAVASEAAAAAKSDSTSRKRVVAAKARKLLAGGMRAAAAGPDKGDRVCRPATLEAALVQEGVRASASAGAQSLPEMQAPCGWPADTAPVAYASASNLMLAHAGASSASSCASADSGPAALPGQPPLSGYAAALKHSSTPQPGAKLPVAAAVPADGVEAGVQHEAAGGRDSMIGHGLSGTGDAHRAGMAEEADARGFEERPPDSWAAAGQAWGIGTREGGGAALDGVISSSRRAVVGQDAAASGQPQPGMPGEKAGKGGRQARRSDGGEAAQPHPAAQLAACGQEAALPPMAAAGLQSAVAGCEEAAGSDGDALCPQQPGAAPAAPGVSYAAAALRGRAAADTPSPAGAPTAGACPQPFADPAKAPKAAIDVTGTGSASGSDSNSSPEGASSNGWHAVSQVMDGERDALAKHLDERSQAVLQRLSSQQAMHVLSRVVLQQKRIVSRGDMVQNINKLFMAFAKDFVPPPRSGLCTTSPSPSQTLAGSGSSPGGKKPGGSCQAEVAKELTGIKWEAVRQEVASLIVNHSEFLKVEHWDDGVLFWLNHRGSEDEALEALRWIVQRHDFGRASNMPAYLTHWLKACGSQSSSVPASSNGAVAASGSLAASDCKGGMPVAVHRLPKRVQGVLEAMVASCGALSWSHFDAGVMKVLVSLCEKSVDDALDELTALEDSDLASIEKMPAYLNKCLNNRLWSLHKGAT